MYQSDALDTATHIPETTAQHLARSAITAMTQAILPAYAESPILTDNNRQHPELTEDDPTPAVTDSTGPPADQAA